MYITCNTLAFQSTAHRYGTQLLGCLFYTTHNRWIVCFTRHTTPGVSVYTTHNPWGVCLHDTQPLGCLIYTTHNRWGVCLHDTQPLGCLFTRHTTAGVFALHDTKPLGCLLYTTHNRWGVCFTQYTYHRVDPAAGEVCSK